jgi:hypothetical protein
MRVSKYPSAETLYSLMHIYAWEQYDAFIFTLNEIDYRLGLR